MRFVPDSKRSDRTGIADCSEGETKRNHSAADGVSAHAFCSGAADTGNDFGRLVKYENEN